MEQSATDLHAQADRRYAYRVDGLLLRIPRAVFPAPTNDDVVTMLREAFSSSTCDRIEKQHEVDLSFFCNSLRYRATFSKQQGAQSFSFRVVPQRIPQLADLGLPPGLADLVQEPRGLLLVTGASGQGKSTRACALLQLLNETAAFRVITIKDPIEYLFVEDRCQFEQREVGVDTDSFADAFRTAVRQDPEVIFHRPDPGIPTGLRAGQGQQPPRARLERHRLPAARAGNRGTAGSLPRYHSAKRGHPGGDRAQRPPAPHRHHRIVRERRVHSFDQHLIQLIRQGTVCLDAARYYAANWNQLDMEMNGLMSSLPGILKPDPER